MTIAMIRPSELHAAMSDIHRERCLSLFDGLEWAPCHHAMRGVIRLLTARHPDCEDTLRDQAAEAALTGNPSTSPVITTCPAERLGEAPGRPK